MKTCAEETFGQKRICLHESTSVLLTIRFEDNYGRPDTVEASTGENDDSILRCLRKTLIVLVAGSLVLFRPGVGICK